MAVDGIRLADNKDRRLASDAGSRHATWSALLLQCDQLGVHYFPALALLLIPQKVHTYCSGAMKG
jgi:hypothetical protein